MNIEEFKKTIGECVLDTDRLVDNADKLVEAFSEITNASEAFRTEAEELKIKNDELRDLNVKLYLRQTSEIEPEYVDENTYQKETEILINKIKSKRGN